MSVHPGLDEQLAVLSAGRLDLDLPGRRLRYRDASGARQALEIGEKQLRDLLQRLLLTSEEPQQGEPIEAAVRLLLRHLDVLDRPPTDQS